MKGMSTLVGMIVVVVAVLLIIVIFFPKTFEFAQPILGYTKEQQPQSAYVTTGVGEIPPEQRTLTGTRDQVLGQLVSALHLCWTRNSGRIESYRCFVVTFTDYGYSRDELVKKLRDIDEKTARRFNEGWGTGDTTPRGDTLQAGTYLICSDKNTWIYDQTDDMDLFITNNLESSCN